MISTACTLRCGPPHHFATRRLPEWDPAGASHPCRITSWNLSEMQPSQLTFPCINAPASIRKSNPGLRRNRTRSCAKPAHPPARAEAGSHDHHANISTPPSVDRKKELVKVVGKTKAEVAGMHGARVLLGGGRALFETKGGGIQTTVKALSIMTHTLMDNGENWFDVYVYMDEPTMMKVAPVPHRSVSFYILPRQDPFVRTQKDPQGRVIFPEVIQVEGGTHHTEIRSAVVDCIGTGSHVVLRCLGAPAVESSVIGIAYTRKCMLEEGIDLATVPTFTKVGNKRRFAAKELGYDFFLFLRQAG